MVKKHSKPNASKTSISRRKPIFYVVGVDAARAAQNDDLFLSLRDPIGNNLAIVIKFAAIPKFTKGFVRGFDECYGRWKKRLEAVRNPVPSA